VWNFCQEAIHPLEHTRLSHHYSRLWPCMLWRLWRCVCIGGTARGRSLRVKLAKSSGALPTDIKCSVAAGRTTRTNPAAIFDSGPSSLYKGLPTETKNRADRNSPVTSKPSPAIGHSAVRSPWRPNKDKTRWRVCRNETDVGRNSALQRLPSLSANIQRQSANRIRPFSTSSVRRTKSIPATSLTSASDQIDDVGHPLTPPTTDPAPVHTPPIGPTVQSTEQTAAAQRNKPTECAVVAGAIKSAWGRVSSVGSSVWMARLQLFEVALLIIAVVVIVGCLVYLAMNATSILWQDNTDSDESREHQHASMWFLTTKIFVTLLLHDNGLFYCKRRNSISNSYARLTWFIS